MRTYICRKQTCSKYFYFQNPCLKIMKLASDHLEHIPNPSFPKLVRFQGKPSLKTSFKENFDFNLFEFPETYCSPSPWHPTTM